MLKSISIKNLGCFDGEGCRVDFSKETLLAGPNNSGKSMLFTAMNLIRCYALRGAPEWDTEYYYLHDFKNAVNNHDIQKKISVSLTLTVGEADYTYDMILGRGGHEPLTVTEYSKGISLHTRHVEALRSIWYLRPNRAIVPYETNVTPTQDGIQPLRPSGWNVINYLLERWTDRDEKWDLAESWLKKIDPDIIKLKTPIRGNNASIETSFGNADVNASLQGSGIQSAAAILSAIVFSPKDSTVIIEEPEVFLHPKSQEIIVDMINEAVNNYGKQVIFSTHSCNMLLPFFSDIGTDAPKRSKEHAIAEKDKFSMWTFGKASGKISIEKYPLQEKTWKNFRDDFKYLWG